MVTQQSRFLDQGCSTANKPRAFECQYGNVCDTYVIRPYVSDTIKNTGLFGGGIQTFDCKAAFWKIAGGCYLLLTWWLEISD